MALSPRKILDYFELAFDSFTHRKTRTFLTMIGIFIGIAAVVSLISLGQGMQRAVDEEFKKIGSDKIMVVPGSTLGFGTAFAPKMLSGNDLEAVRRAKGVDVAGAAIIRTTALSFGRETRYASFIGIPTDASRKPMEEMLGIEIESGRPLSSSDKYSAVVGQSFSGGSVFSKKIKAGDTLSVNGTQIRVVGLLKKSGNPATDGAVVVPIDTAKQQFNTEEYGRIVAKLNPGIKPADLVEQIKKAVRRSRGSKEGEEDFTVQTSESIVQSFNAIFNVVQVIVIGIAAISLVVGGIGIMNTMYTAVAERTKEIGIMKAIGARNSDIMAIFLIESGLLGMIGGLIGMTLGVAMSLLGQFIAEAYLGNQLLRAYLGLDLLGGALLFSFVVGSVSGVFPARMAASLRPVDAIRYE